MAGIRTSLMANFGRERAKEAWRTAGRLWIAFEPKGHDFRGGHCKVARWSAPERNRAVCEMDRLAASALLL